MDLTDAMLDEANARIAAHGWSNVELVKSDAAVYVFPSAVDGILSTFALTLVPEFDEVVRNGALAPFTGKALRHPRLQKAFGVVHEQSRSITRQMLLTGPFGGTLEMASRKPWQSLEKHLALIQFTNLYLGGAYIAAGEKPVSPAVKAAPMKHGHFIVPPGTKIRLKEDDLGRTCRKSGTHCSRYSIDLTRNHAT